MENNSENTFGFELLYQVSSQQLTKKEDVLVLFTHWLFLKNGFKCLGLGDSKTIGPEEKGSELLPAGWSDSVNYTLRYVKDGKLFILMGIKSESNLLINLLRIDDQKVYNVEFSTDFVQNLKGPLNVLIPSHSTLSKTLYNDLILPVHSGPGNSNEVSTQTSQEENRPRDYDPLRVDPPRRSSEETSDHRNSRGVPRVPEFGDLQPGGSGGMIFDPFHPRPRPAFPGLGVPGRLPPGAVPPGARFDPFGPPDVDIPFRRGGGPPDFNFPPGFDDIA